VWTKENNGVYSIYSAYQLYMQDLLDINHFRVDGVWNSICRLNVPPKVTNFIWRVCRNCLPTHMRLRDKGVNCPSNCAICDSNDEDSLHLFLKCHNSCRVLLINALRAMVNESINRNFVLEI